ncbi:MAG: hypothetical protein V4603_18350 [Pseudomonadota bacterium]
MKNEYGKIALLILVAPLLAPVGSHAQALPAVESAGQSGVSPAEVTESSLQDASPEELLKRELRDVVTSWASAWQSQLDDVYLLHYHPDYKPEGFNSPTEWRAARRTRLKDPANIRINLREFEVIATRDNSRALVRFWLFYSRPGYADQTRKEMELRKFGQIWLIASERNLEVTKLAPP